MSPPPLRSADLQSGQHGRVLGTIGRDIVGGVHPEGTILDPVSLTVSLGVSRSVLREVFRVLQSLGMVQSRPHAGTRILTREHWDLLHPLIIAWRSDGGDYLDQTHQILQLRLGVESVAAQLAATEMSEESLHELAALAHELVRASSDADERAFLEADVAFHTLVLRASGNPLMVQFASTVEAMLRSRAHTRRATITTYSADSAERHVALAAALSNRDPELSRYRASAVISSTLSEDMREFDR